MARSIFELSYQYATSPVRVVTDHPSARRHEFVPSTGTIRKYGAPYRNPPAPRGSSDYIPDPTCKVCRMYPNHPRHLVFIEDHDPGDEDVTR